MIWPHHSVETDSFFKAPDNLLPQRGILPSPLIEKLCELGHVFSDAPILRSQIQPASLDLRLGPVAYRVRASFLPGHHKTISERLKVLALHSLPLERGMVLEVGCVYIIPLQESLSLPLEISASANPKSSTGRLDVFTRVITDGCDAFDTISSGYEGPLYLEVSPKTFPIVVREHSRLSQIRFHYGHSKLSDNDILNLHSQDPLIAQGDLNINNGLGLRVDLTHKGLGEPVGYRALPHCGVIDLDRVGEYDWQDFWEPILKPGPLILDPGQFYILCSQESVRIPPLYAAEMVPFNPIVGEFRVHYAGFFDPGFGHHAGSGEGSRAVLEVRSHDIPFILEDGQLIGRLIYDSLLSHSPSVYGGELGSHYQGQRLKLSKHFR